MIAAIPISPPQRVYVVEEDGVRSYRAIGFLHDDCEAAPEFSVSHFILLGDGMGDCLEKTERVFLDQNKAWDKFHAEQGAADG